MLLRAWAVTRRRPYRPARLALWRYKHSTYPHESDVHGAIHPSPVIDQTKQPTTAFRSWIKTQSVSDAVEKLRTSLGTNLDTDTYNALFEDLNSVQAQQLYDLVFRHTGREANMNTYIQLMRAYIQDDFIADGMDIYYKIRAHSTSSSASKKLTLDGEVFDTLITTLTEMPIRRTQDKDAVVGYMVDDDEGLYFNEDSQPELLAALNLLHDMRRLGVVTSNKTYVAVLDACARSRDEYVLEQTHLLLRMDVHLNPDETVLRALENAYRQVGDESTARQIMETSK